MEKRDHDSSEMDNKLDLIEVVPDPSDEPIYNEEETKQILRKVDWRLLPMLTLLFILSFLDRSNSKNIPTLK
jgi:hypothetical protein